MRWVRQLWGMIAPCWSPRRRRRSRSEVLILALAFLVPVLTIMSAAQFQVADHTLTGESANAIPAPTTLCAAFFTCHPPPDSGAPATPTLQTPANAATVTTTPTLTALYSDPEGSSGYLTFEICTTSNCNGGGQPVQDRKSVV